MSNIMVGGGNRQGTRGFNQNGYASVNNHGLASAILGASNSGGTSGAQMFDKRGVTEAIMHQRNPNENRNVLNNQS